MLEQVVATFSTWATPTVQITRGELWDANDPVVRAHPDWFTSDPDAADLVRRSGPAVPVAETTTAEPGEMRHLTLPDTATGRAPRTNSRKASDTRG